MVELKEIMKLKNTIAKHFVKEHGMPGEATGKALYVWETEKGKGIPFVVESRGGKLVVRHPSKDEPLTADRVYIVGKNWGVRRLGELPLLVFLEGSKRPADEIYGKERLRNLLKEEKKRGIPLTAFFFKQR